MKTTGRRTGRAAPFNARKESAQGLVAVEYGRTPFVIATSHKGVDGLSLQEVADIYAGRTTAWPDGTQIRLVMRPRSDIDFRLLAKFSPEVAAALDNASARDGMVLGLTDQDAADSIANLPGGIGTSSLAVILSESRPLRPLAIDGVGPTASAIADGSYPHLKSLFLATLGHPEGVAARFLRFVFTAEGARILEEYGHLVPPR